MTVQTKILTPKQIVRECIDTHAAQGIQDAFQAYVESGGKGICEFRNAFITCINDVISTKKGQLAANRSSNQQWRQDIKNYFGGRGRKWLAIPLEVGLEALTDLVGDNDADAIKTAEDFARQGFAWVRFYAPVGDSSFPQVRCDLWHQGSSVVTSDIRINLPWSDVQTYEVLSDTPRRLGFEDTPTNTDPVSTEPANTEDADNDNDSLQAVPADDDLSNIPFTSIDDLDDDTIMADLVNED